MANFESNYWHPSISTDIVLLTIKRKKLSILLVKKLDIKNGWVLPGGFLEKGESLENCARRQLKKETGVEVSYLSHFSNYSDPHRGFRQQEISVAFLAVYPSGKLRFKANSDVLDVNWFDVDELPNLAFDHNKICQDGIKFSRSLLEQKPELALAFHKEDFTLTELQQTFSAFGGTKFLPENKRNFRLWLRSFGNGIGLVTETESFKYGKHRPAKLFKPNKLAIYKPY